MSNSYQPFRIAFIGGGINSAVGRAHFSACRLDGRFELVAGCFSRHDDINQQTGAQYGVVPARIYSSFEALIQNERANLDAVVILTPTPAHRDPIIAALAAGIPVICEKALVASLEDAIAVRKAEQSCKGFLAITYNYTGYPMLREMRSMVDGGRLGRLLHLIAEMPQEGFVRRDASGQPLQIQPWRLKDGPIPGVHLDLGVHLHQIVHYLTQLEPTLVYSHHASYGEFAGVVDYVAALVEYGPSVHAVLNFGKSMLGHRNGLRVRLYGERASAEWVQGNPEEVRLFDRAGSVEVVDRSGNVQTAGSNRYARFKPGHPAGYVEAFGNVYFDVYDCLRQFKSTGQWHSKEISGSETAVRGLQLLKCMNDSARTGMRVSLTQTEAHAPRRTSP